MKHPIILVAVSFSSVGKAEVGKLVLVLLGAATLLYVLFWAAFLCCVLSCFIIFFPFLGQLFTSVRCPPRQFAHFWWFLSSLSMCVLLRSTRYIVCSL